MRRDSAFLAGTTAVAAIMAFHFWNQLRERNALADDLRQQVEQLRAERNADPARVASTPAAPQPAAAAAVMSSLPAPAGSPGAPAAQDPATAQRLTVISGCDRLLEQARRASSATSAEMASRLNLSPDEALRFAEIRAAQAVATAPCTPSGPPPVPPEQVHSDLVAMLGPARYEQMQEILAEGSARQNMNTLMNQLSESGAPLTAEQSRQLVATILEENRRTRREARFAVAPAEPRARLAYEEENLRLTEERYERTLKAAQAYLRPEQLAQLRGNMTRQANAMRTSLDALRTRVETGRGIPQPEPLMIIREVPQR